MTKNRRMVGELGGSKYITLPDKWCEDKQIEKGEELIVEYNGILKVIPTSFTVEVEGDVVWFVWKKKKSGIRKTELKRLIFNFGLKKAVDIIVRGLKEKEGFPTFPEELIEEKLGQIVVEFVKEVKQ